MHFQVLKLFAGLLAISPLLHAVPAAGREPAALSQNQLDHSNPRSPSAYLHHRNDDHDEADSATILDEYKAWAGITDDSLSKRAKNSGLDTDSLADRFQNLDLDDVSERADLVKRVMGKMQRWDDTWKGFIVETPGWTADTIKDFARQGYDHIVASGANPRTVVSALWIPGRGCYLGSLPKDEGQRIMGNTVEQVAPLLFKAQKRRRRVASGNPNWKYHAEDMACYEFERVVGRAANPSGSYPDNSMIFSYGWIKDMPNAGPIGACREGTSSIDPACTEVMHDLNVGVN